MASWNLFECFSLPEMTKTYGKFIYIKKRTGRIWELDGQIILGVFWHSAQGCWFVAVGTLLSHKCCLMTNFWMNCTIGDIKSSASQFFSPGLNKFVRSENCIRNLKSCWFCILLLTLFFLIYKIFLEAWLEMQIKKYVFFNLG